MPKSNSLSTLKIKKLKEPGRYADGGGLYLQISRWNTCSWIFRFERGGRERQMGLGPIDLVSLKDARERAWAARRLLLDGQDPIEARKEQHGALRLAAVKGITFEQCARSFIEAHAPSWRNEKHQSQWHSTLATYAYPIIGKLAVGAIDTALILKILEPIWVAKTETANRLRGRIEQILDWAKVRDYRQGENPARWRGHLDKLLARRSKVAPRKHRAALPYAEVGTFMAELTERPGRAARALEFLILTAARTGEVLKARRREIDLSAKIWTVPANRTKSGREHRVPLSARALMVLNGRPLPDDPDALIFPGRQPGRPLSNMAMLKMMGEMRPGLTVHGFRSTFKDWAAETTRHENIVTEMALAHRIDDDVEAAYRRGDLFQKRRALMEDWAHYCQRGPAAEVIAFPGSRQ
jgi:integrase